MKQAKWLIGTMTALTVGFTFGCAKNQDNTPAAPNVCTKGFAQDYLAVRGAFEKFVETPELTRPVLKEACDTFFANQSARSCTAKTWMTNEDVTLAISEIEDKCKAADLKLAPVIPETASVPTTPAPPSPEQKGSVADCTQEFVDAYNGVLVEVTRNELRLENQLPVEFDTTLLACQEFEVTHEGTICRAEMLTPTSRSEKKIEASYVKARCEAFANRKPEVETARESLPSLKSSLTIEVQSPLTLNFMLMEATQPYYLIEGRLQTLGAISSFAKAACTLKVETARKPERLSPTQVFGVRSTSHYQRESKTFTYVFLNSSDLVIECVKDGKQSASVADLREAFGDLISIETKK